MVEKFTCTNTHYWPARNLSVPCAANRHQFFLGFSEHMDRNTFLAQADVRGFIDWLQVSLPQLEVHLHFLPSKFVKGGLNQRVVGIEQVHALYRWGSAWQDYQTGQWVTSSDWASTKGSLGLLRSRLSAALASGCDDTAYQACCAVLQWGGVRGALAFLGLLRQQRKLVHYLNACRPLFELDAGQQLADLDARSILRFDAGLTKIHSLIDTTGSPIYDSRVGAAIAMLYALYRQGRQTPAKLRFPRGGARGNQVRDPGALGLQKAPQFFTKAVPGYAWARSQVELGWIIQATLAGAPTLFSGSLQERCHSFEAALFMIGYDLRCLLPGAPQVASASAEAPVLTEQAAAGKARSTWVPTSVNFPQVLIDYLHCSQSAGQSVSLADFRQWQVAVKGRTANTAQAYCAPLRPRELDLVSFSIEALECIAEGGAKGLEVLSGGVAQFVAGDEYEQVYLTNVYLSGRVAEMARMHAVSATELLTRAGFAGNANTAGLILRTGRALGRHFGLFNDDQPSPLFTAFFGEALMDLDAQLTQALKHLEAGAVDAEGDDLEYSPEFAAMIHEAAAGEFEEVDVDELLAMLAELARTPGKAAGEEPDAEQPQGPATR